MTRPWLLAPALAPGAPVLLVRVHDGVRMLATVHAVLALVGRGGVPTGRQRVRVDLAGAGTAVFDARSGAHVRGVALWALADRAARDAWDEAAVAARVARLAVTTEETR